MKIGQRINDLRLRQKVTLKELSKKTGLTASFLSQVERALASPSVGSLEKIAHALNTRISRFFDDNEHKEVIFVRKGRDKRYVHKDKKAVCETLASGFLNINVQPQIFTLPPDCELAMELTSSVGDKFGVVLKGKLEFLCDKENLIFEEGDSIYCTCTQKIQKAKNIGETESKLLWIVFRYP